LAVVLRLKSEVCETGPVALVDDMRAKREIERENVQEEAGKARAEELAADCLGDPGVRMPAIEWKQNG